VRREISCALFYDADLCFLFLKVFQLRGNRDSCKGSFDQLMDIIMFEIGNDVRRRSNKVWMEGGSGLVGSVLTCVDFSTHLIFLDLSSLSLIRVRFHGPRTSPMRKMM
jgi:hypothetical protein